MKKENNAGYSLIEVLVAILLLGILAVPLCDSLVMGHKMNVKSQELLQAQLEVSAALEQLMAEGISQGITEETTYEEFFPDLDVTLVITPTGKPYYTVTVTSGSVSVETTIRMILTDPTETSEPVPTVEGEGGGTT